MTIRKPRPPRGSIAKLPADQQRSITAWIGETLTYAEISGRALAQFGVKLSATALGNFHRKISRGEVNAYGERAHRGENNLGVQITVRQVAPNDIRVEVRPLTPRRRGRPRNTAPAPVSP